MNISLERKFILRHQILIAQAILSQSYFSTAPMEAGKSRKEELGHCIFHRHTVITCRFKERNKLSPIHFDIDNFFLYFLKLWTSKVVLLNLESNYS